MIILHNMNFVYLFQFYEETQNHIKNLIYIIEDMQIFLYLFLFLGFTDGMPNPVIENYGEPSCRNCIHYRPSFYSIDSSASKCANFGRKDIITGKIEYKYAEMSRNDESACGHIGKYYVLDQNADLKLLMYSIVQNTPNTILISLIVLSTILTIPKKP